jgi:tRNA threonylcarbamoyl adenosine modification protein YjeE
VEADTDPETGFAVDLPDEAATAALAEDVAACLAAGDVVALSGGLGAGKTTFARALLRALADDPGLEVPSPTFTLVQTYATPRLTVAHFDLYRLTDPRELDEIGFFDTAADGAVVVEWPERAAGRMPAGALAIVFEIIGAGRRAVIAGGGSFAARLRRSRAAREFLDRAAWPGATRRHLQGDASSRTFERIVAGGRRAVLMDWPPGSQLPEGDARAAYRARDVRAFLAVDDALRGVGISAPEIYAADTAAGFLVMEDLGDEGVVVAGTPDAERYAVAIEVLAHLHAEKRPETLPAPDGGNHRLPVLEVGALMAEIGNYLDWYIPRATGRRLANSARDAFVAIWSDIAGILAGAERTWVLFDVQSPNLFWLPDRQGVARIGIVDFQDMFSGASAYDVASLCHDARVTVPAPLERSLRERYVALRRTADPAFDVDGFARAFAIAAASRATKNLGAFARLVASGRTNYIKHLPRTRAYLARALANPVLSPLAVWYEDNPIP